jgi:hypothetical protein
VKSIWFLALVLMLGCRSVLRVIPETPAEKSARYVREHHCVLTKSVPPFSILSVFTAEVEQRPGYKDYACPGINNWVLIENDEAQP